MNNQWKKILVSPEITILETMKVIDENAMKLALAVDKNNRLLGSISDGDIRRALLKGISLNEQVKSIMNTRPTTFHDDEPRKDMLVAMRLLRISQIPIVDNEGRVAGLAVLDSMLNPTRRDNPVVLMAGGLGSRLRPLTQNCPKPLLNVGGQPVLETILENFIDSGFHKFYFSVNYKAKMIEDYFGDGSRRGIEINYIHEDKKMGTAGALSLLPQKPEMPVIVMNGDILTKINFLQLLDFHSDHRAIATMCAHKYDLKIPYGVIKVNKHRLIDIEEKPTNSFFINAGIYVLDPMALDYIPSGTFYDMPTLFTKLIEEQRETAVFPIREYWLDIGHMSDFERAQGEYQEIFNNEANTPAPFPAHKKDSPPPLSALH